MKKSTPSKGFWADLPRPIMALAPLAGVTDAAFRPLVAHCGKPDVMFTEFVSCDGLSSAGRENLLQDLQYDESERPIVAQVFGSKPESFYSTAKLLVELGFDGLDINTGCPDKNVEKQGAGCALIKNPGLMQEILAAAQEGAGHLPVSVKTRIGYSRNVLSTWLPVLLAGRPAAVTIHARTRSEMSKVPARWETIAQAVQIRDQLGSDTLILGNGDVTTLAQAEKLAAQTGCDGVMVGRGIFGNPWFFNRDVDPAALTPAVRLQALLEHATRFVETFADRKSFVTLRRHFKWYVTGFDQAKSLRTALVETNGLNEVRVVVADYLQKELAATESR